MAARLVSSIIDFKHTLRLVYQHAVESVNSYNLIKNELHVYDDKLSVGNKSYELNNNVYLIGFGKAVLGMGYQAELQFGNHLKNGILSIPLGQRDMVNELSFKADSVIKIFEGAENNIPDEKAENTAKLVVSMVQNLTENDILLVLISGGGSALLPLPIPPVTLKDKIDVITSLQKSGADITELNSVRKQLSLVKGGGLLNIAHPAKVIAFILSDIVGDPLDLIASAPTVVNKDSPQKAKTILKKYSILDQIPNSVIQVIDKPLKATTDLTSLNVQNVLIGTNRIALNGALVEAKKHEYDVIILTDILEGLVSEIYICYTKFVELICKALFCGLSRDEFVNQLTPYKLKMKINDETFSELADKIYLKKPKRLCLLLGGEPTVKVTGSGKGGRSQQLCLQFSNALDKLYLDEQFMKHFEIGLLCAGTDGIDGPTDAAGAIAYNGQIDIARKQNLNPSSYISNCDAYTFFSELQNGEDLLKIGHTGTNVMDVHVLLIKFIES